MIRSVLILSSLSLSVALAVSCGNSKESGGDAPNGTGGEPGAASQTGGSPGQVGTSGASGANGDGDVPEPCDSKKKDVPDDDFFDANCEH